MTDTFESIDYYARTLNVLGQTYAVMFVPHLQVIIYTNLITRKTASLDIEFGWICSKSPADFILVNEIIYHMETTKP